MKGESNLVYTYKHTLRACYFGYITQAIVNNLVPILFIIFQDKYDISYEMLGRLILINFGTQIIADILSAKYIDTIGYRKAAVTAHILCTAGLVSLGILPSVFGSPYIGILTAIIIYVIGGGIIEVMISPVVDSLPSDSKASAMSLLHSFYCWGQMSVVLITTIILRYLGSDVWAYLPLMWALIPFSNLFLFLQVPFAPPIADDSKIPARRLMSSKAFVIALILMMCAGSSELVMSQWSSLFAEQGLGISKLEGDLLGPCLFAILMGLGRTAYGIWGRWLELKKALAASSILCLLCYLTAVFAGSPFLALAGCALCGLSVSLMWPGVFSMTSDFFPGGGTLMFGILAIFGDLGASIGPWSAGFVSEMTLRSESIRSLAGAIGLSSEQLGLKSGLLISVLFPAVMFIGTMLIDSAGRRRSIPSA